MDKKEQVAKLLKEEDGIKKLAWASLNPFILNPDATTSELKELLPEDVFKTVMTQLAIDYATKDLDPTSNDTFEAEKRFKFVMTKI